MRLTARPYDIVVFGATGFTGRQCAAYLAATAPSGLRWTVAGRRRDALEAVARDVGCVEDPIVADVSDASSVVKMAESARVLVSTAGPYTRLGDPVVDACVAAGTHYSDITGESPWVKRLIDRHHATALERGTRIVPMCGFDSVPSDVGTRWLIERFRERFGQSPIKVEASFSMRGGGLNGGSLASGIALAEAYSVSELRDPYLLSTPPASARDIHENQDPTMPVWDASRERWMAPFVMGLINTRVVRRTASLLGPEIYPEGFAYQEYMDVRGGRRSTALAWSVGLQLITGLLAVPPTRALFRAIGPRPGEGPSEEAMARGSIEIRLRATDQDGQSLSGRMRASGDAGNVCTVRFLMEAALALACDGEALGIGPGTGGVLTPAVALWPTYVNRLIERGVELSVEEDD